jgi:NADH:ubiquinone oxidoreductase subunit E
MKKIKVTICCGTYCHVMGGAEVQLLDELIPPEIAEHVDMRYSTCLGYCKEGYGNPPFVEINGKYMAESNVEKITQELRALLEGMQDDSK